MRSIHRRPGLSRARPGVPVPSASHCPSLVPTGRLELPRLSPLPPQDSVSTNFTTSAFQLSDDRGPMQQRIQWLLRDRLPSTAFCLLNATSALPPLSTAHPRAPCRRPARSPARTPAARPVQAPAVDGTSAPFVAGTSLITPCCITSFGVVCMRSQVGEAEARHEEHRREHGRRARQEIGRAGGAEEAARRPAAERGPHVGALAVLQQHESADDHGDHQMYHQQKRFQIIPLS